MEVHSEGDPIMDAAAQSRREAARHATGQFGTQTHSSPAQGGLPSWPAAGGENVPWERDEREPMSRRERNLARGPFVASIPPEIATVFPQLPARVLADAADAHTELARFDSEVGTLHAPLAAILLRTESSSSSEVERLTASAKQVALARIGDSTSANAQMVLANTRAMESAMSLSDNLSTGSVIEMHRALLERHDPEIVGQLRDVHVWVGGRTPHTAEHVGPVPQRVPALMDDLMQFARRDDLPVLPHIALAHAQFETIHPFPDGNGRAGRALVHAMLRASGTTRQVTVPVSAGLLSDPQSYFDALNAYRDGDATPIVEVLTYSSFRALSNARQLVTDLGDVRAQWEEQVRARKGSSARRALDVLAEQPVVTVKHLAETLGVSEVAANSAIATLADDGVLRQSTQGRRNRHWQADGILDALDRFGARARRASS